MFTSFETKPGSLFMSARVRTGACTSTNTKPRLANSRRALTVSVKFSRVVVPYFQSSSSAPRTSGRHTPRNAGLLPCMAAIASQTAQMEAAACATYRNKHAAVWLIQGAARKHQRSRASGREKQSLGHPGAKRRKPKLPPISVDQNTRGRGSQDQKRTAGNLRPGRVGATPPRARPRYQPQKWGIR